MNKENHLQNFKIIFDDLFQQINKIISSVNSQLNNRITLPKNKTNNSKTHRNFQNIIFSIKYLIVEKKSN